MLNNGKVEVKYALTGKSETTMKKANEVETELNKLLSEINLGL